MPWYRNVYIIVIIIILLIFIIIIIIIRLIGHMNFLFHISLSFMFLLVRQLELDFNPTFKMIS